MNKGESRCESISLGVLTEETHTNETRAPSDGERWGRAREGASSGSLKVQHRTERKQSAVEASQPAGELAGGSKAHIRRAGGRKGVGVGVKFCVLTRGDLSASAHGR
jgi:hypothetical protein